MPTGVYERTEEYKKKMRELCKGRIISEETRRKISEKSKGRKHSEEAKQKISRARKGSKPTKSSFKKGHKISEELKEQNRKYYLGRKMPQEVKEKIRLAHKGKHTGSKCNFWKGGLSSKNQIIRHSHKYLRWRKKIFERDNYTCVLCGVKGGRLNADHLKSFSQYPKLRFSLENGRTLCIPCHRKTDNYGNKECNRQSASKGISIPWPSIDELANQQL